MRVAFRWALLSRARFHVRAANWFWLQRADKPPVFRGANAPPPPIDRLWTLVRFPGGAYGGIVNEGVELDFVRALHGREVTIRGETLTLDYSPAREFVPGALSVDLHGDGSVIVSDPTGVEAVVEEESDP